MGSYIPGESKVHEVLMLGEVGREPERQVSIRWSHMDMQDALELTRDSMQPTVLYADRFNPEGVEHSPTNPAPDFANELHAEITDALDLWEEQERLCYYIGVHGPADSCGIDCWFEYQCRDGRVVQALIDHTEDPNKYNPRADHILLVDPDKDMDNGEGYKRLVKKTAAAVTKILRSKESQK